MDWQMPGLNGVNATRALMHELTLQHRPTVVIVTAFGADEVREEGSRAGATAFVDKPVSQSRLWDTLAEAIYPHQSFAVPSIAAIDTLRFPGMRVLLVEDNEINQQIACELLESLDVEVNVAQNGQEALDLLAAAPDPLPWSLVFMDLQMPVLDGHQATIEIRRQPRFDHLPIIAMTAHAMEDEVRRCLAEGMNHHLSKPIDPNALVESLRRWGGYESRTDTVPDLPARPEAPDADITITGMNTAQGLRNCLGNVKLYLSLLEKFHAALLRTAPQTREALQQQDYVSAQRAVHTLKGISFNLGADACGALCHAAEQALKARMPVQKFGPQLQILEHTGTVLARHIAQALTQHVPVALAPQDQEFSREMLMSVCLHLSAMLQGSDAEAQAYVDEHAQLLRSAFGQGYGTLLRQVELFEFEEARLSLASLMKLADAVRD
jgi:CheY-like chemotaxis protein